MSGSPFDPVEAARLLRQRLELGAGPLFLEGLDRDALAALLQAAIPAATPGVAATTRSGSGIPAGIVRPEPPRARSETLRSGSGSGSGSGAGIGSESTAGTQAPAAATVGTAPPDTSGMGLEALREAVLACTRCRLGGTRTQAVFSDGHPSARVMIVGEAPGANEDETGVPFVGAAGKLLDLMLASVGLSRRDSVYICNVIKCRPPGNRNPEADEIDTCAPWLHRQIELVGPEVILAVGTFAGQLLSGHRDRTLGALRGELHSYRSVPVVVTYHPAALLRNGSWARPTWDDLQLLRQVLDGR